MNVTMMVLVLYLNGAIIEFMGHHETDDGWERMGMSGCLQVKRTLKRNGWKDSAEGNTRYACEKRTVELKTNWEGNEIVFSLIK
jgi:hypothetical protein|tara:strand:+ start:401 stop:652 length:252 start_codon:yes stop_codon:yes gene_type:complete